MKILCRISVTGANTNKQQQVEEPAAAQVQPVATPANAGPQADCRWDKWD